MKVLLPPPLPLTFLVNLLSRFFYIHSQSLASPNLICIAVWSNKILSASWVVFTEVPLQLAAWQLDQIMKSTMSVQKLFAEMLHW